MFSLSNKLKYHTQFRKTVLLDKKISSSQLKNSGKRAQMIPNAEIKFLCMLWKCFFDQQKYYPYIIDDSNSPVDVFDLPNSTFESG